MREVLQATLGHSKQNCVFHQESTPPVIAFTQRVKLTQDGLQRGLLVLVLQEDDVALQGALDDGQVLHATRHDHQSRWLQWRLPARPAKYPRYPATELSLTGSSKFSFEFAIVSFLFPQEN